MQQLQNEISWVVSAALIFVGLSQMLNSYMQKRTTDLLLQLLGTFASGTLEETTAHETSIEHCYRWDDFLDELHEWADSCPLEMNDRARLFHLQEEVSELQNAPNDSTEMADVGLVLLKHCYEKNTDLLEAMIEKFNKIRNSKWHPPDNYGIVRRVKEQEISGNA